MRLEGAGMGGEFSLYLSTFKNPKDLCFRFEWHANVQGFGKSLMVFTL